MENNYNKTCISDMFANKGRIAEEISGLSCQEKAEALNFWQSISDIALTGPSRCGQSHESVGSKKPHSKKLMILNEYRNKK